MFSTEFPSISQPGEPFVSLRTVFMTNCVIIYSEYIKPLKMLDIITQVYSHRKKETL